MYHSAAVFPMGRDASEVICTKVHSAALHTGAVSRLQCMLLRCLARTADDSGCAGDQRQLQAAAEMHDREWFWHKTLKQWMRHLDTRQTTTPQQNPADIGLFAKWNAAKWVEEKTEPTFLLDRALIEEVPALEQHADAAAAR